MSLIQSLSFRGIYFQIYVSFSPRQQGLYYGLLAKHLTIFFKTIIATFFQALLLQIFVRHKSQSLYLLTLVGGLSNWAGIKSSPESIQKIVLDNLWYRQSYKDMLNKEVNRPSVLTAYWDNCSLQCTLYSRNTTNKTFNSVCLKNDNPDSTDCKIKTQESINAYFAYL